MTGKSQKRSWLIFLWLMLLTIVKITNASTFVPPLNFHPSTLNALNRTTAQGYNTRGLLGTITEPSGQVTTLGYDGRRRLTSRTDAVGTVNYGLDDAGQLLTVTQGSAVLTRTYHDSGEVKTYTNANNETISYDYDKNGNLVSLTYSAIGNIPPVTVTYAYDNRDRLTSVTDWMGRVTSYTWDDAGRLTQVTRPNATKRTLKWDAAGQLLGIEERPGNGAPLALRSFQYDTVGRLTKRLSYPQGVAWSEPAWNAVYNDDNRLTTLAGIALIYDTDGNLLGSRLPDGPWGAGGTSANANGTFTWNARNQLIQVVRSNNAQQINYTYDAEGHLIQTTDNVAGTTRWIIDPNGGKHSRILAKVAPNGQVTRYVHGVGLVYEVRQDGGVRYYHYDQVGNMVALTDHNAAVTGAADYTPYGNLQSGSGELANANTTPFLFVGAYGVMTDAATGLHQMRARWYSSHLRRFLSEDPAGFAGGENFYVYASNNPINRIDPLGLKDLYTQLDIDAVPVLGIDVNLGFKIDFDDFLNSGYYFSFGLAAGGSAGIAVGGGYAIRNIEGKSLNFDVNPKAVSVNAGFDDQGFNSMSLTFGPGGGALSSYTNTYTFSPRSVINTFAPRTATASPRWIPLPTNTFSSRSVMKNIK